MNKTVFFNKFRRLFGFVLTISLLGSVLTASAQNARVSIKMENAPISQVMKEIENQTRYLFINKGVDTKNKVSINAVQKTIQDVLAQLFAGTEIAYRIDESYIILTKKNDAGNPVSVTGKIRDANGNPIVGASVLIQGTTVGVSSDADGAFALQVPPPAADRQLEISFIGYNPVSFVVGSRTAFDVTLEETASEIESVVVTALGIKRSEKAVAYNVQQVKAEDITTVKDANFINSLTGKVAGVTINTSSSGVGGASKVTLRGNKSISQSSNALYVIDGIPMYNFGGGGGTEFDSRGATESIADINPEAQVEALDRFVLAEDVPEFLDAYADRVDYVVDAIDTISAKLAVAQYADAHGVRLVSSMGAANKLRPEAFRFADVFDTVSCPLCRIMRKEARKRGIRRLRVLYSCEQPVPVPVREGAERRERSNLGTASFVPPIMGQMIAGEVLCALAGVGAHAGEEHA